MSCDSLSIEERSTTSSSSIEESCSSSIFWSVMTVCFSSIEERSQRETGVLQCSPMREIQLKRNREKRRNRTREQPSPATAEEELTCFDASPSSLIQGFMSIWSGEKSLCCFIFAIRVNNVSYECYIIFVTQHS